METYTECVCVCVCKVTSVNATEKLTHESIRASAAETQATPEVTWIRLNPTMECRPQVTRYHGDLARYSLTVYSAASKQTNNSPVLLRVIKLPRYTRRLRHDSKASYTCTGER